MSEDFNLIFNFDLNVSISSNRDDLIIGMTFYRDDLENDKPDRDKAALIVFTFHYTVNKDRGFINYKLKLTY